MRPEIGTLVIATKQLEVYSPSGVKAGAVGVVVSHSKAFHEDFRVDFHSPGLSRVYCEPGDCLIHPANESPLMKALK